MAQFKKKNSYRFWHSPLALIILFCVFAIFAYNMISLVGKERETSKKKEHVLEEIDTLNKREKVLSSDISRLNTEEGIEEMIREKYQVVKPGEKVVVIVDQEEKTAGEDNTRKDHSFWGFIKRMFGK
ncbi:MAG: septum formation initiator family protein [Patescibacteria group bacterium]